MARRAGLIALAWLVLPVAASPAGTVALRHGTPPGQPGGPPPTTVFFDAGAGERNALTVTGSGASVLVTDMGAGLTAGFGCVREDANRARCFPHDGTTLTGLTFSLLDGDDRVWAGEGNQLALDGSGGEGADRIEIVGAVLAGGPGDDVLAGQRVDGEAGNDTLIGNTVLGGPGDDVIGGTDFGDHLLPGPGHDVVRGAAGDDTVVQEATGERDEIHGDAGIDRVDYGARTASVRIRFRPPGSVTTVAGSGDTLAEVESIFGSQGNDVIVGSAGPERLDGGAGADRISGGSGDDELLGGLDRDRLNGDGGRDTLAGGEDFDRLDGGDGDDTIRSWGDLFADRVDCGGGTDRITREPGDRIGRCERREVQPRLSPLTAAPGSFAHGFVDGSASSTLFKLGYSCELKGLRCRGYASVSVRLAGRSRHLGRSAIACAVSCADRQTSCLVEACKDSETAGYFGLPRSAVAALQRGGRILVTVVTTLRTPSGGRGFPVTERFRLSYSEAAGFLARAVR